MKSVYWAAFFLASLAWQAAGALGEAPARKKRLQTHGHVGDYVTWCALHLVKRQYHEAVEDCDEALSDRPKDPDIYSNRSGAYFMVGEVDKAIADIEAALRLNASDSALHYNHGLLHANKGQLAEAVAAYTEAIRLNPLHVHAYNNRGALFERIGERERAIGDYRTALQLAPGLVLTRHNLNRLMGN